MSAAVFAVDALVALGVIVVLLCTAGLLAMRDATDQVHYVGPATTIAPIFFALAITIEEGLTSQAAIKAISVAAAIIVTSPIVSYATLRAIRTRQAGSPDVAKEAVLQQ